jgi:hypothetical protein
MHVLKNPTTSVSMEESPTPGGERDEGGTLVNGIEEAKGYRVALKPSPTSFWSRSIVPDSPSLVEEPSFDEDDGFLLLFPEELNSPRQQLIYDPRSTASSTHPTDPTAHLPRPKPLHLFLQSSMEDSVRDISANRKRPRNASCILRPRLSKSYDHAFLTDTTSSDSVDMNAHLRPAVENKTMTFDPISTPLVRPNPLESTPLMRCRSQEKTETSLQSSTIMFPELP